MTGDILVASAPDPPLNRTLEREMTRAKWWPKC